jgi:hypothetical protein
MQKQSGSEGPALSGHSYKHGRRLLLDFQARYEGRLSAQNPKATQDDKEQIKAFRKAARELGCDESEKRFQQALRTITKQKPQPRKTKKQARA